MRERPGPDGGLWVHRASLLARAHGGFNVVGGLWPIVSIRTFEAVLGPKEDRWLVYTVGGLMTAIGLTQLTARRDDDALRLAERVGVGTAATLLAIDVIYVPAGRLRWTYLLDAAAEVGWLMAWAASHRGTGRLGQQEAQWTRE